ncbi:MAG: hypothetical protein IKQ31_05035 [Clostridia bacterium]|nr:hypothetical protein [Clostridia bacterium]
MNTLEIVTIVTVILILITLLPIFINVEAYINVLANVGVVTMSMWGIRIKCIQFELSKEMITIIKKRGKSRQIKLNLFDPHLIFVRYLIKSLFAMMILKHVRLYVDVGSTNNALFASLLGGGVYAMLDCAFAILKTRKNNADLLFDVVPHSEDNENKISGSVSVIVCPILLIYSLIRAKVLQKRWFKIYERYSI